MLSKVALDDSESMVRNDMVNRHIGELRTATDLVT